MAATAAHCIAANQSCATVLHADVRHLSLDTPSVVNQLLPVGQRLLEPINLVVYEVRTKGPGFLAHMCGPTSCIPRKQQLFDAGLLGENVLPVLAHAHEHLAGTDAPPRLVPRGAQVYCQLLQYEWLDNDQPPAAVLGDGGYEAVDLQQARSVVAVRSVVSQPPLHLQTRGDRYTLFGLLVCTRKLTGSVST